MKKPSKAQKKAINHLSGPAQIIAGPGSGKTFTIIQRILYLIQYYHVRPDKILVITYTKAAANEMKERLEHANAPSGVCFGTFHSICYYILKKSACIGENSLIKEVEKRKLLQIILGNQGLATKSNYESVSLLLNMISYTKNVPDYCLSKDLQSNSLFSAEEILAVKEEYNRHLREQKMIDFDDMITECLNLLSANREILNFYREMFHYIMADEFQDINMPQYQILKLLAYPKNNLFVVGDDDQAIYGFRGASPDIMKRFTDDFPDGKQIMLTENYRSGQKIVSLAGSVISGNKERFIKQFYPIREGGNVVVSCFDTRKDEELQIIRELSKLDNEILCNTALLLRTNMEVIQYTELLKDAGISIKETVGSKTDIFHSFIMKDITAFLSYLYFGNKRSDLIYFMNKPNRFFTRMALPYEQVLPEQMEKYYRKNPQMTAEVKKFFAHLKIASNLKPVLAVAFFRKTLGYDRYLQEKAGDLNEFKQLQKHTDSIQQCFASYSVGMDLKEFIYLQAEKAEEQMNYTENCDGVRVLTMHSSKGLEFVRVYLPDVNDGVIPSRNIQTPKELEEERRLLYVAMTRARDDLFIYYTKERGRKISRYLENEMIQKMV